MIPICKRFKRPVRSVMQVNRVNDVKVPIFIIPSRGITRKRVMTAFQDFGFFAVFQPRHPFPNNTDIDCEMRFRGAVRSIRSTANLSTKPFSIIVKVEMKNGEKLETTVFDMKSFDALVAKIGSLVKNLTIVAPGIDGEDNDADSAIDIVGEDQ